MNLKLIGFFLLVSLFELSNGHGMLLEPVNRASRWRFNNTAPVNWSDNELYCGGYGANGGKCGLCGDSWSDQRPRRHELGGEFGEGVIVRNYTQNGQISFGAMLTVNHKGYFQFSLCNLDQQSENENCFEQNQMKFINGDTKFMLPTFTSGWYNSSLLIPSGLKCQHCVLQWNYITGNTWGPCGNGTSATGCGPQETFRTCSDISIV